MGPRPPRAAGRTTSPPGARRRRRSRSTFRQALSIEGVAVLTRNRRSRMRPASRRAPRRRGGAGSPPPPPLPASRPRRSPAPFVRARCDLPRSPQRDAPRKSFREIAANSGRPSERSSPSRRSSSTLSSTPLSKSGPGSSAIALLGDARRQGGLDPLGEPRDLVRHDVAVARGRPVLPRRALDVHEDVAAAGLGDEREHLVRAAGDVVDRRSAGVERRPRDLDREGVGQDGHPRSLDQPGDRRGRALPPRRRDRPAARCAPRRPRRRAGRSPPSTRRCPSATACSGVMLLAPE